MDSVNRNEVANITIECAVHEILEKDARIADLEADNLVLREMVSEATAMLYQQTTRVDRQTRTIVHLHEALRAARGEQPLATAA